MSRGLQSLRRGFLVVIWQMAHCNFGGANDDNSYRDEAKALGFCNIVNKRIK